MLRRNEALALPKLNTAKTKTLPLERFKGNTKETSNEKTFDSSAISFMPFRLLVRS